MKKQILILTFLVLAVVAGTSKSYAQAVHDSSPQAAVSCTNDALHPIAGKPYEYSVTTDPGGGTYLWWATTNTSFISGGTLNNTAAETFSSPDVAATTAANYNQNTSASTVELTWGTDVLAAAGTTPTFVAVYYTPPSGSGCADNLKVYQVEPINAFTVDITNVDDATLTPLAYGTAEDQCFDDVQSAQWDSGTGAMVYDYGTNVLYFEIVAANFTDEWTPTFQLTGLDASQTATIEWDYATTFGSPVTVTSGTASATAVETNETDTSNGVSIYARVTISNGTYEGIADQDIALAVTGTNTAGQKDVKAADCSEAAFADNTATQTLNERPEVIDNTDTGTFE